MNTFYLIILPPDGYLFDGEVVRLSVLGVDDDLAVLARHISLITAMKSCECCIELADGNQKTGYTGGGLLSVSSKTTTLLSDSFHRQKKADSSESFIWSVDFFFYSIRLHKTWPGTTDNECVRTTYRIYHMKRGIP